MPELDFDHDEEYNGGSVWPNTHTLRGLHPDTGEEVGSLKYKTPRRAKDKIKIDMLKVHPDHRGNGYGNQLMDELQQRHPKTPIDHGDRTDDGKKWWESYSRGKSVQKGRTAASRQASGVLWSREAAHDDLDDIQRHALHRLDGMDELIQGHEAAQLMREHGIHHRDDDPYEAGEVGDDHMVHSSEAGLVHHSPDQPLHTSQDTLYKSGLEHYIRHPHAVGGGGIGPRPGPPVTWEHNGEHWITEGHHRILADRMTYRNGTVASDRTNRRRLGFKEAAMQPLYHGTSVPDVHQILPASRHGQGMSYGPDISDPSYAYATTDHNDAWEYAMEAHGQRPDRDPAKPGRPRVYEVHPIGGHEHVEPDPDYEPSGEWRGVRDHDMRSPVGFHVGREMEAPEHVKRWYRREGDNWFGEFH